MNMRHKFLVTGSVALFLFAQSAYAGNYTAPKAYTSGDILNAADLNAENAALKSAIDDNNDRISTNAGNIVINDGRVTTVTTQMQNLATGCSSANSSIKSISSNGTIVCETDDNTGVAGVEYGTAANQNIATVLSTLCGASSPYSVVTSISVTAPTAGYIMVTAGGRFCTYTGGDYAMLALSNVPGGALTAITVTNDAYNTRYTRDPANRACAIGQFDSYNFQNVYRVTAAGTYTYYLKGCISASTTDGILNRFPMIGTFFPNRY